MILTVDRYYGNDMYKEYILKISYVELGEVDLKEPSLEGLSISLGLEKLAAIAKHIEIFKEINNIKIKENRLDEI